MNFENTQYSFSSSFKDNHVSHFFWSKDENVAYAASYKDSGSSEDVFFTNKDANSPNPTFTAAGIQGKLRTLSMSEWQYLLEHYSSFDVTVCGKKGRAIAPEGCQSYLKANYNINEWSEAEAAGLIFIPGAGYRTENVVKTDGYGYYWSSEASGKDCARYLLLPDGLFFYSEFERGEGAAVRLVTEEL